MIPNTTLEQNKSHRIFFLQTVFLDLLGINLLLILTRSKLFGNELDGIKTKKDILSDYTECFIWNSAKFTF